VRAVVAATDVLANEHRRALDSTILDDAVATQDTVTQVISAVRRVLTAIPALSVYRGSSSLSHDYATIGKPVIDWSSPSERDGLVSVLITDATAVLDAVAGLKLTSDRQDAVGVLALVSAQDVKPGDEDGTWHIGRRVAKDRVISTVDPEARVGHKSVAVRKDGFKAHVCVEPDTDIITGARITPANGPDGPSGLERRLNQRGRIFTLNSGSSVWAYSQRPSTERYALVSSV
jgi:hypothetical protein